MNWLERARREILENGQPPTANSAVRSSEIQESGQMATANTAAGNLPAVTAVPTSGFCEKHEGLEEGSFDRLPETPEAPEAPSSGTVNTTSGSVATAPAEEMPLPGGPPSPPVARPRGWSAADWRLFHNDRQLVAEIALGHTRGQARVYAFVRCVEEWRRVRPGSSEAEAIAALAVLGITDPSPPLPPPAVEHLQATGHEDDFPPAPAGGVGAGTDVTGSPTPITAPQRPQEDEWSSEDWIPNKENSTDN